MGLIKSLRSYQQGKPLKDPALARWFGVSTYSNAGVAVTPETALGDVAVMACVNVIAQSVAQLPLFVYKSLSGGGKDKRPDHRLYRLLHDQPNARQTSFEFREMFLSHLVLRGNAYAYKKNSPGSALDELIPMHPDKVIPFLTPNGLRAYQYTNDENKTLILLQDEVMHLMGLTLDGIKGLNPIEYQRETIGLSLAAKEYGARLFSNNATPKAVLQHPKTLSKEAQERLKESWYSNYGGLPNSHKIGILEEGMEIKAIGMTAEDAQFIETRKMQRSEIAALFRVPPHKIGDLEKATFTNIEQQSIEFLTDTLLPHLTRFEQVILRDLFLESEKKKGYFAKFSVDGFLRGDTAARATFYKEMFYLGAISPNEIREYEDKNPIEDGDKYYIQANLASTDSLYHSDNTLGNNGTSGTFTNNDTQPTIDNSDPNLRIRLDKVVRSNAERVLRKEIAQLRTFLSKKPENYADFRKNATVFYEKHAVLLGEALGLSFPLVKKHVEDRCADFLEAAEKGDAEKYLDALAKCGIEELIALGGRNE